MQGPAGIRLSLDSGQSYRTFASLFDLRRVRIVYELRITWDVQPRTRNTLSEKVEDGAAVLKTKGDSHIYSHCSLFSGAH